MCEGKYHYHIYLIYLFYVKAREIFLSQPVLLELEAPLKICGEFLFPKKSDKLNIKLGDVHGQ